MNCVNCGRETLNPKFCSKSCAAIVNNKASPKRKRVINLCNSCGGELPHKPTRRTKCDECLKAKDMTLQEAIYTLHHRSSAYALVRSRARSVLQPKDKSCETCGYSKHVEVCHITPIGSFPLTALVSEVNSPSNLKALCPNCHWEFDNLTSQH